MGKGVSEKFDENEQDTARRAYSKEIVERSKRTAKMERLDLDKVLRTESGTRPAVGHELIAQHRQEERESNVVATSAAEGSLWEPAALERHVRARMEDALIPAAPPVPDVDPHSRPTIEAFRPIPLEPALVAAPQETAPDASPVQPAPAAANDREYVSIPRWLLTVALLAVVTLVLAAGGAGFLLGRSARPASR